MKWEGNVSSKRLQLRGAEALPVPANQTIHVGIATLLRVCTTYGESHERLALWHFTFNRR